MKIVFGLLLLVPSLAFTPRHYQYGFGTKIVEKNQRYSDSSRSYANLSDPPVVGSKTSFESRMRNLVLKPIQEDSPASTLPGHPAVHRVTSLQDYKRLVVDQEKLTVVRFYADYCRACRAMTPAPTP